MEIAEESLRDLGIHLNNDFQAFVFNYTRGWLTEDLFTSDDELEITGLYEDITQIEQVIDQLKAWEKLLTTGFIPSDMGKSNLMPQGEKIGWEGRSPLQADLDSWRQYEALIRPQMRIFPVNPPSPDPATAFNPPVTPQRTVNPVNYPEIESSSPMMPEPGLREKAIATPHPDLSSATVYQAAEVLPNFSDQAIEDLSVEEFGRKVETQSVQNVNLSNGEVSRKATSQRNLAANSAEIKSLKDLSTFLAAQPNQEHIIEADSGQDLHSKATPVLSANRSHPRRVLFQEPVPNPSFLEAPPSVSKAPEIELTQSPISESSTEIFRESMPFSDERDSPLEMENILEAITLEINREYRRFYGDS